MWSGATRIRGLAVFLLPSLLFIMLWILLTDVLGTSRVPAISDVAQEMLASRQGSAIIVAQGGGSGGILPHVRSTLVSFGKGFMVGSISGIILALALSESRILLSLLLPVINFLRAIPPLLVIPFIIIIVRDGDRASLLAVACVAAMLMFVYTLNAVSNIHLPYLLLGRLLGVKGLREWRDIKLPALMPELVGGIRVSAALSLGVAVVAEYLAVPDGIGRVIKYAVSYSSTTLIVAAILWSIIAGLLVDLVIVTAGRLTLRWSDWTLKR